MNTFFTELINLVGLQKSADEKSAYADIKTDTEMLSTTEIAINNKNRIIESIENDTSYLKRAPVSLNLKDLSLKLKGNEKNIKDKTIVYPFNAHIEGASLFAILGGSGSGKTSLLNIIANRFDKKNTIIAGNISYSTDGKNSSSSSNNVGYVTQNDFLLPYLTVRETLIFTAKLKIPIDQNNYKRDDIVNQVIMDLGLKEVADSLIGENEWKRGLSGGEKRRVSIAVQIISNPPILCLDEITSGLDSFTALTVTESLLRLSKGNRQTTVICSVHQPRSDVFYIFDSVLLLSRGGRAIYCGKTLNMIKYFSNIGFSCPINSNPADFFVDISSIDIRNSKNTKLDKKRVEKLIDESFKVENFHLNQAQVTLIDDECKDIIDDINLNQTSWFYQVFVLLHRFLISNWRDSLNIMGGIIQALVMGLIIMGIFWNLESDNQSAIRSRYGLSYIIISAEPYILMIILVQKYTTDLKIFDRELLDKLYKPSAYLTAHVLASLPQLFVQPFLYGLPIYFGCNMREGYDHILIYLGVNILISFIINGIAWMSCSLQRSFSAASLVANMNFTFIGLTSGFLVNFKELPIYVKWVRWISYHSYSYRILMTNEFSNRIFSGCKSENPSDCIMFNGNFLLSQNNVKVNDYQGTWPVLFAMIIVYHLIAYINLNFIPQPPIGSVGLSADDLEDDYIDIENIGLDDEHHKHSETRDYELISTQIVDGVQITLNNIHLSVSVPKQELSSQFVEKKLLSSIYSTIEPGRLVALMGGSGSGKSTLMNLIAGRIPLKQSSKIFRLFSNDSVYNSSGQILFNGIVPTGEQIRNMIGYMQQNDFHIPCLTAMETLLFHASLRLHNKLSKDEMKNKVIHIISMLGLKECANTKVGNEEVKGISGGEKRRLSLGIQMLTDPKVCLIDEVTTALDAFTARSVVETLKDLSRNGRTIILAIHQPRYDVFALLDDVILLSRGQLVWSGASTSMISHFKNLNYNCPLLTNPGDFILDLSSIDFRSAASEEESTTRLSILVKSFSTITQGNENAIESISKDNNTLAISIQIKKENPLTLTLPLLLSRSILNQIRQPVLGITRVQQGLSFALILSCFYAPVQDNQNCIQNRIGNLYMMTSLCFIGMLNCIAVFPLERNVFYREYIDGGYTPLSFFLSYLIICTPFLLLSSMMLSVLMTFAIGLKATSEAFLIFTYVVFTFMYVGEMIGISYLSLFYHVGFSVNIMSVFISFFCMMAGFISIKMSLALERVNYISPLKYGAYILTNTIFKDMEFKCDDNEKLSNGECAISNGEMVLKLYNMYDKNDDKFIMNLWILGFLSLIYTLLAYIILRYRAYKISH